MSFYPKRERDHVRSVGRLFAWTFAVLCIAPVIAIVAIATTVVWQQGLWAGGFTLQWLIRGWELISPNFFFSVRIAAITLLFNALLGFPTAWVLARHRFPFRGALLSLTGLPIAVPGIIIALALIVTYPHLRANAVLLIVGHVLYTVPFFVGALVPSLADPRVREMESVAATLGAGFVSRLLFVTLPQIKTAVFAAIIMVFTLSLGEFNASFFLVTPTTQTLPVSLYAAYITGRLEVAAALTFWFLIFVIPAAVVVERLGSVGNVGQA